MLATVLDDRHLSGASSKWYSQQAEAATVDNAVESNGGKLIIGSPNWQVSRYGHQTAFPTAGKPERQYRAPFEITAMDIKIGNNIDRIPKIRKQILAR